MIPTLTRITLYPIKSLDGVTVERATILASGALQHDRTYVLTDVSGRFVNGKRDARIHQVRSHFSPDLSTVTLAAPGYSPSRPLSLTEDRDDLAAWFSDFFQQLITLQADFHQGFPDDTDSLGPTIVSTATLETVASWYDLSLEECRRRFRPNLEIGSASAFTEDQLFSAQGQPVPFHIGGVMLVGINPCQRCIVPTRDSQTGLPTPDFQKRFVTEREKTLPAVVARSRFNHFYRLTVNTRIAADFTGHHLTVSDPVILP